MCCGLVLAAKARGLGPLLGDLAGVFLGDRPRLVQVVAPTGRRDVGRFEDAQRPGDGGRERRLVAELAGEGGQERAEQLALLAAAFRSRMVVRAPLARG